MTKAERELVIATAQAVSVLLFTQENGTTFTDKTTGSTISGFGIASLLIDKVEAVMAEGA